MSFFKGLFKKIHKNAGITGEDVTVAISIIVMTMGVVTSIYLNLINKSRENIRHSNAIRIATGIIEKVQSLPYDHVIWTTSESDSATAEKGNKLFGITVPNGYTATVKAERYNSADVDIVRDIKVTVTYNVNKRTKSISLYTIKEKELLEQTNKPDVRSIENYELGIKNYYPIKKYENKYYVTAFDDPDWYNYDDGIYALLYATNADDIELGTQYDVIDNQDIYVWIPRFGFDEDSQFKFCYGTSNSIISFSEFQGDFGGTICGYMLSGGADLATTGETNNVESYTEGGFEEDDGLSGVWYKLGDTNDESKEYILAAEMNTYYTCTNATLPSAE